MHTAGALFSYQSDKNARGNYSDTVMTRNIQILLKEPLPHLISQPWQLQLPSNLPEKTQSKGWFHTLEKTPQRQGHANIWFRLLSARPPPFFTPASCNYSRAMEPVSAGLSGPVLTTLTGKFVSWGTRILIFSSSRRVEATLDLNVLNHPNNDWKMTWTLAAHLYSN